MARRKATAAADPTGNLKAYCITYADGYTEDVTAETLEQARANAYRPKTKLRGSKVVSVTVKE